MLTKRVWLQTSSAGTREWQMEGWYLFGFIPVYIRDLAPRFRR